MHRVLSFQMARGPGESSEYVTKRLCFSFLFSVGFLCLLCGFLLGRFATERSMEARQQKMRLELAENGLRNTEYFQQLVLQELEQASFDHKYATDWAAPNTTETNMQHIYALFSNLSFIHEVTNHASCVRATIRGSREPDRYLILSVNRDNIVIVIELMQVLDHIYSAHNWQPRRSVIFCVSLVSLDVCAQTIPDYMRHKIIAYMTLRGHSIRANSHLVISGSDIIRSITIETVKTIPNLNSTDSNSTYIEYEAFVPRLFMNIPHVIFSFNESDFERQKHQNQNLRLCRITLAQTISQTLWRLSESIIIQWEPSYFNETINRILELIDIDEFQNVKERFRKTSKLLLAAMKDLNEKINVVENTETLHIRIWNDLLLDLDKMLLCPDENLHSRTDLAIFRKLSTSKALIYLNDIIKCYEDAIQVLRER